MCCICRYKCVHVLLCTVYLGISDDQTHCTHENAFKSSPNVESLGHTRVLPVKNTLRIHKIIAHW